MKELVNIAKSRGKESEEGVEGKTESKRESERSKEMGVWRREKCLCVMADREWRALRFSAIWHFPLGFHKSLL